MLSLDAMKEEGRGGGRYAMYWGANRNCGDVTGDFSIDKRCCLLYIRIMKAPDFEWDDSKNLDNIAKHGVPFQDAQQAFQDEQRVILQDSRHSDNEQRYFCLGKVPKGVLTVRFTIRRNSIRIIGAGFWRKGRKYYEKNIKLRDA